MFITGTGCVWQIREEFSIFLDISLREELGILDAPDYIAAGSHFDNDGNQMSSIYFRGDWYA